MGGGGRGGVTWGTFSSRVACVALGHVVLGNAGDAKERDTLVRAPRGARPVKLKSSRSTTVRGLYYSPKRSLQWAVFYLIEAFVSAFR